MKPLWFNSAIDRDCPCGVLIHEGDPCAWLPDVDECVCFDCADAVEREAAA